MMPIEIYMDLYETTVRTHYRSFHALRGWCGILRVQRFAQISPTVHAVEAHYAY